MIVRLPVPGNVKPELRNDDVVRMRLIGVPEEFARDFQCDLVVENSAVTVPMLGQVSAAGLAPAQLAEVIAQELQTRKIFTAPNVVLERVAWEPFVSIRGDVRAAAESIGGRASHCCRPTELRAARRGTMQASLR